MKKSTASNDSSQDEECFFSKYFLILESTYTGDKPKHGFLVEARNDTYFLKSLRVLRKAGWDSPLEWVLI